MPLNLESHTKWLRKKHIPILKKAEDQLNQPEWKKVRDSDLKVAESVYPKESAESAWARDPAASKAPDAKEIQDREIEEKLNDWPWEGLPSKLLTRVCTL